MKNIVILVSLIALVLIGGLVGYQYKVFKDSAFPTKFEVEQMDVSLNVSGDRTFSISNDWVEVTKENFWNRAELFSEKAKLPYNFPDIRFSYPSNWKFQCCSGMGHGEGHNIIPLNDKGERINDSPSVNILVHVLNGCPKVSGTCALNEQIVLTPQQKYQRLVNNLPENAKVLTKKKLENLNEIAFVYTHSRFSPPINFESYTFIRGNDVVTIEFRKPEELGREFIESFLQRIKADEKSS